MHGRLKNYLAVNRIRLAAFVVVFAAVVLFESFFAGESVGLVSGWFLPVIVAVILFPAIEASLLTLLTLAAFAAGELSSSGGYNLTVDITISAFGLGAIAVSLAARRNFRKMTLVRDAIDQSPLAYAEFTFPGYRLISHNDAFREMIPGLISGKSLLERASGSPAAELARLMDEAVSRRGRVECEELSIVDGNGRESFW